MTMLFEPLKLRDLNIRNRIFLPPMCQYQCNPDGIPNAWHLAHYGARAAGGFGLIIAEATGVVPEGRITPGCCGLWSDAHRDAWTPIVEFCHSQGAAMAIQLNHAGRKASVYQEPLGKPGTVPESEGGWIPAGPSPIPFPGLATPRELSTTEMKAIPGFFAAAATRAVEAGFDAIEIHGAHGYLLSETLSPLSNERTDEYGGSFENRIRLLLETTDAIRSVIPDSMPLIVRISATEWLDDGWTLDETLRLVPLLQQRGVDLMDISSGGNVPADIPNLGPGYQVNLARAVHETGIPTTAVGLITEPAQAESVLIEGSADAVCIGRAALTDPSWPVRAAKYFGLPKSEAPLAPSYRRGTY
jgi:2,4-dienoyl-CoA reductase-like NADH-dependent reductase (Old Yellow Enzyme family)